MPQVLKVNSPGGHGVVYIPRHAVTHVSVIHTSVMIHLTDQSAFPVNKTEEDRVIAWLEGEDA